MDKRLVWGISLAGVLLLSAGLWAFRQWGKQPPDISEPSSYSAIITTATQSSGETSTVTTIKPLYMIGSWEDKLAVFMPPDTSPYRVYDVYLWSLPEDEQQRLKDGIAVYNETMLASLLEDYTS